jgi:CTD kinase subunit gamma
MTRDEIFKRIEADRERHKRLREKRWVQPIPQANSAAYQLASYLGDGDQYIDAEFQDAWENTSDWNEDDDEAAQEEEALCFAPEGDIPMRSSS